MKAIQVSGWGETPNVVDLPRASAGHGQAVVRVDQFLIGASDLSFTKKNHYQGTDAGFSFPHVPGFRAAGVIEEARSERLPVGTRVVINGFMGCGRCRWCDLGHDNHCQTRSLMGVSSGHQGAGAEFVAVPEHQCHPVPPGVGTTESLLCADASLLLHAYLRADLHIADCVLVVGAGRVGALAVAVAKAVGAVPVLVLDPSDMARQRAIALGATGAYGSVEELMPALASLPGGGADVVVEAVGTSDAISMALASGRAGARTLLLGTLGPTRFSPNYYRDVINKENELISSFGKTNREFGLTLRMMGEQVLPLEPLMPERFSIDDFDQAWEAALVGTSARVAIEFTRSEA